MALFIDIRKGFDSLPRQLIFDCLRFLGCPPALLKILQELHTDVIGTITGSGTAAKFTAHRGVRQGSTEGPLLFNIVYECLLQRAGLESDGMGVELDYVPGLDKVAIPAATPSGVKVSCLEFVDNLCLLAHSPEAL